jgi:rSAM/selenodomain-associated transferase 1
MKQKMHENQLLVFTKYPEEGKVKTRLAPHLGMRSACAFHKQMVMHLMKKLDEAPGRSFSVRMVFSPPERETEMKNWLGAGRTYMPQRGPDLGARMENAFLDVFLFLFLFDGSCKKAVIVGCDVPDLSAELIAEAFDRLEDYGAVLGPSMDGGYYLIGFKREEFAPQVFKDIQWGGGEVFSETLKKMPPGCRVHLLPKLRDVDTAEDLMAFYERKTAGLPLPEFFG